MPSKFQVKITGQGAVFGRVAFVLSRADDQFRDLGRGGGTIGRTIGGAVGADELHQRPFDRAAGRGGADCRFTLSLSRTQTGAEAMALVEDMKAHRTHRLAGLSIDGNEALAGRTGERFRPAFLAAGAAGFGRTAHAGESSGPDGVRDALDLLEADRLDHGVRAAEDADLTARLVRERVPLNICLTSNLTLLYRRREDHPLRRLLDAGAVVTLSRDDPTFLGGLTLTEELRRAAEFAYMSREELLACQEAAVDAAFCGPETKNFLRRALAEFQQS